MFDYLVSIYRKPSAASRQNADTGRYDDAETLVYENVEVELQPKARVIERNGIKIEITTLMFCGVGLDLEIGDTIVEGDNRYEVVSDNSVGESNQWFLRRIE